MKLLTEKNRQTDRQTDRQMGKTYTSLVKVLRAVWFTALFVQRVQDVALFVWKTTTLVTLSLLCRAVIIIMIRVLLGGYSRW